MFMLTWSTSRVISLLSRLSDYSHSTPTVLRDTLGYYSTHCQFIRMPFWYELHSGIEWYSWVLLHPLSVHQNFIPIWTTLWYWEIFLGITPPVISSSELHSDMNFPPGYQLIHHYDKWWLLSARWLAPSVTCSSAKQNTKLGGCQALASFLFVWTVPFYNDAKVKIDSHSCVAMN